MIPTPISIAMVREITLTLDMAILLSHYHNNNLNTNMLVQVISFSNSTMLTRLFPKDKPSLK